MVRIWKRREATRRRRAAAIVVFLGQLLLSAGALASMDLSGDGKTDVPWRQFSGQPLVWLMDGISAPVEQSLPYSPGNEWQILGTGTFDGSSPELAFLNASGQISIWQLSKGQYISGCSVSTPAPAGAKFVGIGDVDGDGKSDLLWDSAGNVLVWFMNGCAVTSTTVTGAGPAGANAVVVADFNGDGHADVLWHELDGSYSISASNGGLASLQPSIPADWQPAASPFDFDGDGKADLVWRLADGSVMLSFFTSNGAHNDVPITPNAADEIFGNNFETDSAVPVAALPLNWKLNDAGNYGNNTNRNLLFVDEFGNSEIWDISGTQVVRAVRFAPAQSAPYAGQTGWVLPVDRPTVTESNGQVTVAWTGVPFVSSYTLYASANHNPAETGTPIPISSKTSFTYSRNDLAYVNARYFSVVANMPMQQQTPPSLEAYLLEFDQFDTGYEGPMTIADIDGDGCIDIVGALGDCHGGFTLFSETAMGMSALRANGRAYRDLRLADFDGDGIDDAIANVYSWDTPYTDPTSHMLLFWGIGHGQFVEDAAFSARNMGGFGETIVLADFDNDGSVDIFLPKYTFYSSDEHNYLLMNDGHGNFTDMADSAGVAMRNIVANYRPEGAHAADLDGDGRIDLYAGSHLFMNRTTLPGQPVFDDQAAQRGLSPTFDEGAGFLDWNNDGNLDLVILSSYAGPQLWQNDGFSFQPVNAMPALSYNTVYGINMVDLDGDGKPDLVISGGCEPGADYNCDKPGYGHPQPRLLLNRGTAYQQSFFYNDGITDDTQRIYNSLQTFADFDDSGTMDVASLFSLVDATTGEGTGNGNIKILLNRATSTQGIRVTVLGTNGEHNQFGRVVRVAPAAKPGFVMTQIVDGGSAYLANAQYTLLFAAPYPGAYRVNVGLADRVIELYARAGDDVVVYADGQVGGVNSQARVTMRPVTP